MKTASVTRQNEASWPQRMIFPVAIALASIFAMIVIGGGAFAVSVISTIDSTGRLANVFKLDSDRPAPTSVSGSGRSAQNILVLGTDLRGAAVGEIAADAPQQLDTAMLVHIAEDRRSVQMLSFRRDMLFAIPRHGEGKLNVAFKKDGPKLVVHTIEKLVDVRIDHVVLVDLTTAENLTNALGGVTVSNAEAFDSSAPQGLHFNGGLITLNGEQALAYVREAKAFPGDSNARRLENQKSYLDPVLKSTFEGSALTNPKTLSDVLRAVADGSFVDSGFNSSYILGLAYELRALDYQDIRIIDYPTMKRVWVADEWGVKPKTGQGAKINSALREDSLVSYFP